MDIDHPTLTGIPFNDAYRYMDWLLTVPLLLVEILLVMKLDDKTFSDKAWRDEHLALIAYIKAKYPAFCIVGNSGGNHTAESVYGTKKGFAAGMDCALLINPYYGKTSKKGIIMHIEAGMKFGPAIIYNVPGRTGQDIKPEVIYELAKHENFCGVKECMGNARIKTLADKGIMCWSGNDEQSHDGRHNFGGLGVISVTSNVVPGLMKKLMTEKDDAANAKLKPIFGWLFEEPNPIGVNTLLMQLGVAKP